MAEQARPSTVARRSKHHRQAAARCHQLEEVVAANALRRHAQALPCVAMPAWSSAPTIGQADQEGHHPRDGHAAAARVQDLSRRTSTRATSRSSLVRLEQRGSRCRLPEAWHVASSWTSRRHWPSARPSCCGAVRRPVCNGHPVNHTRATGQYQQAKYRPPGEQRRRELPASHGVAPVTRNIPITPLVPVLPRGKPLPGARFRINRDEDAAVDPPATEDPDAPTPGTEEAPAEETRRAQLPSLPPHGATDDHRRHSRR